VTPHGRYLKIVETAEAASQQTEVLGPGEPVPVTDQFVTRLYRLKHIDAAEAATALEKFKSPAGDIAVWPATNLLIVTDTGASIRRLLRIVEEIDSGGAGEQIYLQPLHYLAAADVAAQLTEWLDGDGGRSRIMADERNNNLVIVATEPDYERILEIVRRIDVPAGGAGKMHVLSLQHARCDEISGTLGAILGTGAPAATPRQRPQAKQGTQRPQAQGQRPTAAEAPSAPAAVTGSGGLFEGEVRINCDPATNALVVFSTLRDYAQLRDVIDELDRPRRQVFIEAVIMDVNVGHLTDLGIGFHGGTQVDGSTIYSGSNAKQSITGLPGSLEALAFGVRGPDLPDTGALTGGTGLSIPSFGVVLHALARAGDSNLLATPHILATDNTPATISIGQNIPLQTNVGGGLADLAGQGGGLAGLAGGFGLGFQAPREDVGISLTILPQINDDNQVRMDIEEEYSTAGAALEGSLGAIPINKRNATTTVIVEDQQTIVIGGLTREEQIRDETKIPVLGDIPVLGALFRQTTEQTHKVNLLLILTPHVIREPDDLRRIFERKMQERQEFLDRYFVFDESLPWEPPTDYTRKNGMLEHIRQTQLTLTERERLRKELEPTRPKGHDPVHPIALPTMAGSRSAKKAAPAPKTDSNPTPAPRRPQVPGSAKSSRYRVE
jgi:general secretion pathway protein D